MGAARDIGKPMIKVTYLPATPEQVEQNRKNLMMAIESIESRLNGRPTKVSIDFGEKPEHYGEIKDWRTVDINSLVGVV